MQTSGGRSPSPPSEVPPRHYGPDTPRRLRHVRPQGQQVHISNASHSPTPISPRSAEGLGRGLPEGPTSSLFYYYSQRRWHSRTATAPPGTGPMRVRRPSRVTRTRSKSPSAVAAATQLRTHRSDWFDTPRVISQGAEPGTGGPWFKLQPDASSADANRSRCGRLRFGCDNNLASASSNGIGKPHNHERPWGVKRTTQRKPTAV